MALLTVILYVFAIFAPVASIAFAIFLMFKFRSYKYKYLLGTALGLGVGMVLYNFYPVGDMDAARYYAYMNQLASMSVDGALGEILSQEGPLSYLLMYATSSLLGNHYIMPVVSVICYAVYFYVITNVSASRRLTNIQTNIILIVFLVTFQVIGTITGVRFGIATALFILGLYLESRRKKSAVMIYLFAILFHTSAILLVLMRLVSLLIKRRARLPVVVGILVAPSILVIPIFTVLGSGIFADSETVFKLGFYTNSGGLPENYLFWFNLVYSFFALTALLVYKNKHRERNLMIDVNIILLLVGIGSLLYPVIAGRLLTAGRYLFLMNLPLLVYLFLPSFKKNFYPMWSKAGRFALLFLICGSVMFQVYSIASVNIDWRASLVNDFQLNDHYLIKEAGARP